MAADIPSRFKTSYIILIFQFLSAHVVFSQADSAIKISEFDFSKFPDCNLTTSTEPPVPKLSKLFSIKVEVKSSSEGYFDSDGYYDSEKQRGATRVLTGGQSSSYLYDFHSGNAFNVYGSGTERRTCWNVDLWETGCNPYGYFIAELAGYSNITSHCNLTHSNVFYMGNQNVPVRGIRVQMWQQCIHDFSRNTTTLSKYYFTQNGTKAPWTSDDKGETPIRYQSELLQLNTTIGSITNNSLSIYDFTYYLPTVNDLAVFLPEPGVYCPEWSRENKSLPEIPDEFSLTMMTVARLAKDIHSMKINFDFEEKLVSFITDSRNGTHFPPSQVKNRTLYRIVHDYTSGLSFSIPLGTWLSGGKDCTITRIEDTELDVNSTQSHAVHLKHGRELFGLNLSNWIYVGQRDFNGIDTYVYISQRNNSNTTDGFPNMTITTETYWLKEAYSVTNLSILVGIIIYQNSLNGSQVEIYQSTVSEYSSYPFHWRTFDVEDCLKNDKQQLITFCVQLKNYTEVAQRMGSFETGIRDAIADITDTSPLQFADIQVLKGDNDQAHLWLTVLDWVNVTDSKKNLADSKYQSAADVIKKLEENFGAKDLNYTVKMAGKNQTVIFLKDTLDSSSDLVRPSTPAPTVPTPPVPQTTVRPTAAPTPAAAVEEGYTSGSMAGLGIAMILIGGVAGLVAGFLLWKRNTGIAYQVYD